MKCLTVHVPSKYKAAVVVLLDYLGHECNETCLT